MRDVARNRWRLDPVSQLSRMLEMRDSKSPIIVRSYVLLGWCCAAGKPVSGVFRSADTAAELVAAAELVVAAAATVFSARSVSKIELNVSSV